MDEIRLIVFVILSLTAGLAHGQDRGRVGYTNEEILAICEVRAERGLPLAPPVHFFSAHGIALGIPDTSGEWVDGEFYNIPDESAEDVLVQHPKKVSLKFRVSKVLKGNAFGMIEVELNSDMLVFPGEGISRYAKRRQQIQAQSEELQPILDALDLLNAKLDAGEIDEQAFYSEQSRLWSVFRERSGEVIGKETATRSLTVLDGESFYDHGGAIKENEPYLMQLQPIAGRQNAYYLREVLGLDTDLYWGEKREDVLMALKKPEEFLSHTPFGAYDPNSDEDCQYLHEVVSPVEEVAPNKVAKDLLDRYELVAYGEFLDVPHATAEESRRLADERIEVGFEIRELFKGEVNYPIRVLLNSDMLFLPGENTSRHAKRQEILKKENAYLRPFREGLREVRQLAAVGELDERDVMKEFYRVEEIVYQTWEESDLESRRSIFSLIGETFYDRDGVISPYQGYLVGLNRVPNSENVYLLGELPESPSRIYWGQESEDLLTELREPAH